MVSTAEIKCRPYVCLYELVTLTDVLQHDPVSVYIDFRCRLPSCDRYFIDGACGPSVKKNENEKNMYLR